MQQRVRRIEMSKNTVKMKFTGILGRTGVIRPEWFGFDNVFEYKLDNLIRL